MSEAAKDTIRGLLERKVQLRLGSGPSGAEELKFSPFFRKLDFDRVLNRGYDPEFVPPAALNVDKEFTSSKAIDTPVEDSHIGRETPKLGKLF